MRLDPELKALLEAEGGLSTPDLPGMPLEQALAAMRAAKPVQTPPPGETALTEDLMVPGPNGDIPVRIYRPVQAASGGVLVHFHGGGWVGGSIANDELRCHRTACGAGITIVSAEYRLAPEHPFPAGLDDAYAVLLWVEWNAAALGIDPKRIGVSGSSAGGNIAAALAMLARERGGPALRLQLLTYPICDTTGDYPSYRENAAGPLLSAAMMRWFMAQYLAVGPEPSNPLVATIRASDLSGLPPALIVTAECDPLRDEAEAYGEALARAGVDVTCTRYDGMVHGFITRAPALPASRRAMDQILRALATYL